MSNEASYIVTSEMRVEWFNSNGWYADDTTIWNWYKEKMKNGN